MNGPDNTVTTVAVKRAVGEVSLDHVRPAAVELRLTDGTVGTAANCDPNRLHVRSVARTAASIELRSVMGETGALVATIAVVVAVAIGAALPGPADARGSVYFTDYDSGPVVRPVFVDASQSVRAGPFRRWQGWGTSMPQATVRFGPLRTRVVMRQIRRCGGRRQYRLLYIYRYEDGKLALRSRHTNRACRRP